MAFEFNGKQYTKASKHQREWGQKIIAELQLAGNEHILDLGCGDGVLTTLLTESVPNGQVLGVDASQGMIEAAKQHERSNLTFAVQDINALQLDSTFDLIFSNAALHWILDHRPLLSRVFELLNPDGVVRFNFAADGNCQHFYTVIEAVMEQPQFQAYFKTFKWPWYMPSLDEYRTLVQQVPFQTVEVWGENADRYFINADEMIQWIDHPSIVPFLQCVNNSEKQRFRDMVVERMLEVALQDDGRCFETFRRINVLAKK